MRYVLAFSLGVLVCFIVIHLIARPERAEQAQVAAVRSAPHRAGTSNTPPVGRPRIEGASGPEASTRTSAHSVASSAGHSVDGPRRPASELIEDMIASMGDPVMGKPLLAPHQALQTEAKDEPWSTDAETSLRNSLEGTLGTRFEYPSINCGSDLCEIQAATLGNEGQFDNEDFQTALGAMGKEAWWSTMQLGHPTCAYKGAGDGRELVVCFVTRGG